MEKILEKKYFILGGFCLLIGVLVLLYFVINRSSDGYTNLSEAKVEEKKEEVEVTTITVEVKGEVANPGVYTLGENAIINDLIGQAGGLTENAYTDNINLSKKLKNEMVVFIYKKSDFTKKTVSKAVSQTNSVSSKVTSTTKSNVTSDSCVTSTSDITDCTDQGKSVIEVETSSEATSSSETTSSSEVTSKSEVTSEVKSTTSASSSTSSSSTKKIVNINTATLSELMTLKGIGESKAKKIIEYREKTKFTTPQDITKVSGIGTSTYENIKEYITV